MGLDMYLEKKTYVKNWDHMGADERHEITVKRGAKARSSIKPERISYIIERVAYWRKANAIHKWFVKHVQGGKDDCGQYEVSREQLQALKADCDKVLGAARLRPGNVTNGYVLDAKGKRPIVEAGEVIHDTRVAEAVLPTTSGFFFGSTDYDQHYHADLKETSEALGALLAEPDHGDFYYTSSW